MRTGAALLVLGVILAAGLAADEASMEQAKKEEAHACVQCHSLRLVHSQRLSTQAWTKEVDKMIGWGAPVHDRQLLIDYYSKEYSDAKPVPSPDRSAEGAKQGR